MTCKVSLIGTTILSRLLFKFLKNQGVLLALCSKNNAEDVQYIFDQKKGMVLESDDFIFKKVN